MKALVVFRRVGDHWASRWMGRWDHVFCVISTDGVWVRIDAREGLPETAVVARADYDLATFYRGEGYGVLCGVPEDNPVRPMVLGNCVGLIKAFLGIRCRAVTPMGLYRYLKGTGRWT